jgi:hypothetical protein
MLLEKFILSVYMKNYQQISSAKKHLFGSVRELLMAASFSMDIVNQMASQNIVLKRVSPLQNTLKNINDMIRFSARKMGNASTDDRVDSIHIKNQILEALLGALEEEIDNVPQNAQPKNQLKVEALRAVKKALLSHMSPGLLDSDADSDLSDDYHQAANE